MNSKALYLIRFDDICPSMNWDVWDRIEEILDKSEIKPILAVVPDNKDQNLNVGSEHTDFWNRVRNWQAKGWTIGLHGCDHVYVTKKSGILRLNSRSEFAGLSENQQEEKLARALSIFSSEGVRADIWVSPAHSFDKTTVKILRSFGLRLISDGYFFRMVDWLDMTWIPQQLWRFRNFKCGLWTVCFHHNKWGAFDLDNFEKDVLLFLPQITSVQEITQKVEVSKIRIVDRCFNIFWLALLKAKRLL